LARGSHRVSTGYSIAEGKLSISLSDGSQDQLRDPDQLLGYRSGVNGLSSLLLVHNGLHVDILLDRNHEVGGRDVAGIADIAVESALSTIMDLEGLDCRCRPRRQGRRLSQLAGSDAGQPV
jgi:malate synthase